MSPDPLDAPAKAKKRRIVVKVRKSTNISTRIRVLDPDSLYRLRDYPEDNHKEFVIHELADAAQELAAPEGGNRKAETSLAWSSRKNLWPLPFKKLL